jgi:hypothetical protein
VIEEGRHGDMTPFSIEAMTGPIDTQFYVPLLPANIVALPNSYEVHAMRALLEILGCVVTVHWIGTPIDFLKVLGQGDSAPRYLLIAGHGDAELGYYFGEYADFIDTSMLHEEHMPAEVIAPVVDLPGCTVISTSCGAGVEAMGRAFTKTGKIEAYIGCRAHPGSEIHLFVVSFFFSILRKKLSDYEAWQKAMLAADHPATYQMSFFRGNGEEERYQMS